MSEHWCDLHGDDTGDRSHRRMAICTQEAIQLCIQERTRYGLGTSFAHPLLVEAMPPLWRSAGETADIVAAAIVVSAEGRSLCCESGSLGMLGCKVAWIASEQFMVSPLAQSSFYRASIAVLAYSTLREHRRSIKKARMLSQNDCKSNSATSVLMRSAPMLLARVVMPL